MRKFGKYAKGKKGFTLMEVVVALAVVGIISAIILPLLATAVRSFTAAEKLRTTAATASKSNATANVADDKKDTLYVTVQFEGTQQTMKAMGEGYKFTKTEAKDKQYDVVVTYYELKSGDEVK